MAAGRRRKSEAEERHRVDRWLWFARFFKSRSLAAAAVAGGRVRLNGARVKPAHEVAVGDMLDVAQDDDVRSVVVIGLPARRGPAAEAAACFEESGESRARREVARVARRHQRELHVAPPARPDKRARRAIRQLHGRDPA